LYLKNDNKTKDLVTYNDDGTIEVESVSLITKIQKKHFKKGEFFMQSKLLNKLILKNNYTLPEIKTLLALTNRIDFNNRIKTFRQSDIAEEIGSSQPNVSKALKTLLVDKIIYKDNLDYYFNDKYIKGAGN